MKTIRFLICAIFLLSIAGIIIDSLEKHVLFDSLISLRFLFLIIIFTSYLINHNVLNKILLVISVLCIGYYLYDSQIDNAAVSRAYFTIELIGLFELKSGFIKWLVLNLSTLMFILIVLENIVKIKRKKVEANS
jgi:hypothetical protein